MSPLGPGAPLAPGGPILPSGPGGPKRSFHFVRSVVTSTFFVAPIAQQVRLLESALFFLVLFNIEVKITVLVTST